MRKLAVLVITGLLVGLSGCSGGALKEPADALAAKVLEKLADTGVKDGILDCGKKKITITEGLEIHCTLTQESDTQTYDVQVTITKVDVAGYEFEFNPVKIDS
jgi:hypothetical protein